MSVATPSEVNPSNNDAADLQDLLSDYEWELMQSESLDTSIDNASICRTADNTADIVQCYCVPISSWLLSLAVCYVLYSAASLDLVEDTGASIKGNVVDIYYETHEEAVANGRYEAEVFLIKGM